MVGQRSPRELVLFCNFILVTPKSDTSARLEIQPAHGSGERRRLPVIFSTFANKRLTLITTEALGLSTPVGVEYKEVLFRP
jgi:hypothetical protein